LAECGADYSARRQELIRTAAEVFRAKGFSGSTLHDVANALGTDRASLYYYVGSKEELFQACISEAVAANIARASEIAAAGLTPREQLVQLIELLIKSQVEHYPYLYVYIQEDMRQVATTDAAWATDMVEQTHLFERYFTDAISRGLRAGIFRDGLSTTLVANTRFGMTQWTHRWFVPRQALLGAGRHRHLRGHLLPRSGRTGDPGRYVPGSPLTSASMPSASQNGARLGHAWGRVATVAAPVLVTTCLIARPFGRSRTSATSRWAASIREGSS